MRWCQTDRVRSQTDPSRRTWDEFSRTGATILSGLMPWEKVWYERVLKADHILLVGCGTGRDLIALLELGYRVDGLDVSARAIALARRVLKRQRLSAELYTGRIEALVPPATFDAVIFSWFCYGNIPEAAARTEALSNNRKHDGTERPPAESPSAFTSGRSACAAPRAPRSSCCERRPTPAGGGQRAGSARSPRPACPAEGAPRPGSDRKSVV